MISHLIMAFLFGICIGLIDIGVGLNFIEKVFVFSGFTFVCFIHYGLLKEDKT